MTTLNIARGHQQVMSYITVQGAYRFMDFLKNVFEAEEQLTVPRTDDLVMHAEMKIGDSTLLVSDAVEKEAVRTSELFIYVPDTEATYNKALSEGATSLLAPEGSDYAKQTAGVKDAYGNTWWLHTL